MRCTGRGLRYASSPPVSLALPIMALPPLTQTWNTLKIGTLLVKKANSRHIVICDGLMV